MLSTSKMIQNCSFVKKSIEMFIGAEHWVTPGQSLANGNYELLPQSDTRVLALPLYYITF